MIIMVWMMKLQKVALTMVIIRLPRCFYFIQKIKLSETRKWMFLSRQNCWCWPRSIYQAWLCWRNNVQILIQFPVSSIIITHLTQSSTFPPGSISDMILQTSPAPSITVNSVFTVIPTRLCRLGAAASFIIIQLQVIEINLIIETELCTDLPADGPAMMKRMLGNTWSWWQTLRTHDFLFPPSPPSSSNLLISVSLSIASSLCLRRFSFQPSRFWIRSEC